VRWAHAEEVNVDVITSVEQLVARFENSTLDYKAKYDLSNKATRCEIAKDVAAFANAFGGSIVVGVIEAAGKLVKLESVPDLSKLKEEVATALQLHCVPLTPGPEEHEIWVSPVDALRLLAPGSAPPPDDVRLVTLNVRPDSRGPIGVKQLGPSGNILPDVFRFPLRVTDQTRFLDPTELPMWMNSHERRIAIQLRQVPIGAPIRVFQIRPAHTVHDPDWCMVHFQGVDEAAIVARFLMDSARGPAHVPLPMISAVWQEPRDKSWTLKIDGTIFPYANSNLYNFRPGAA
jgi:hypothetical protein